MMIAKIVFGVARPDPNINHADLAESYLAGLVDNLRGINEFDGLPTVARSRVRRAKVGGEAGIRTLGTGLSPYNGLANRRFRPLSHLTVQVASLACGQP
jgi:hypothetical protein